MLSDSLGIVDQAGARRAFDAFLKGKPVPNGRQIMRLYLLGPAAGQPQLAIGAVMRGRGVGQIVDSRHPDWPVGEVVHGSLGWQEFAQLDGDNCPLTYLVRQRIAPVSTALGVLGITGYTAYFGLFDICAPRAGETVVVSGATGGVGSIVGQLAKIAGGRAIAITGGPAKMQLAVNNLGYDAAIDYRSEDVGSALDRHCPEGVDIYFDNIGGPTLDLIFARLRRHGRIALCGRISEYLAAQPTTHFPNFGRFVGQPGRMQGFFIYDYAPRFAEAEAAMAGWIGAGRLRYQEDILEGLEQMPRALRRLYEGSNLGKQLVRVAADPQGWPAPPRPA
jgi:NADPH-dependent curcumin reductase CurA